MRVEDRGNQGGIGDASAGASGARKDDGAQTPPVISYDEYFQPVADAGGEGTPAGWAKREELQTAAHDEIAAALDACDARSIVLAGIAGHWRTDTSGSSMVAGSERFGILHDRQEFPGGSQQDWYSFVVWGTNAATGKRAQVSYASQRSTVLAGRAKNPDAHTQLTALAERQPILLRSNPAAPAPRPPQG